MHGAKSSVIIWCEFRLALLPVTDTFPPPPRLLDRPVRITVADVLSSPGSGTAGCMFAGRVEAGSVAVGDKLVVMPGRVPAAVKKILREDAPQQLVFAGDYFVMSLGGIITEHLQCVMLCLRTLRYDMIA